MKLYTAALMVALGSQSIDGCTEEPGNPDFYFSDPSWVDVDRDARWEPGEELEITALLTNNSGKDYFNYTGGVISTDSSDVELLFAESWFYGILDGDTLEMYFTAKAHPGVSVGTVVTFRVEAPESGCAPGESICYDPEPLVFEVPIE